MDAGSSPFPANRYRDSCHHQELEGELTAESVYQQLRQALAPGAESGVDRVDLGAVTGDLAFQTTPLRVYVFQLTQQSLVYLTPGTFLAGSTALDIVALTAQGHQTGLGGGNQAFDLLDLPGMGAVEVSHIGIQAQQGLVGGTLALLLLGGNTRGPQLFRAGGRWYHLLHPAVPVQYLVTARDILGWHAAVEHRHSPVVDIAVQLCGIDACHGARQPCHYHRIPELLVHNGTTLS